jgi:hypothetical protein
MRFMADIIMAAATRLGKTGRMSHPVPERPQTETVAASLSEHRVSAKAGRRRGAESRPFGWPSSGPTGRRSEIAQA